MTLTTEERCPTCGSDMKVCGILVCPDPWHTTEDSTFREDAETLRRAIALNAPGGLEVGSTKRVMFDIVDRILTSYESMRRELNDANAYEEKWAKHNANEARLTRYEEALREIAEGTLLYSGPQLSGIARRALSEGSLDR